VEASGETLSVLGLQQLNTIPKLVISKSVDQYKSAQDLAYSQNVDQDSIDKQKYLFSLLFETNPLDQSCDSRVIMSFRPLKMVYDAQTIIKIMNIFTTQQSNVTTQYVKYTFYYLVNILIVDNIICDISYLHFNFFTIYFNFIFIIPKLKKKI